MKTGIIIILAIIVIGGGVWITTREDMDIDLPETGEEMERDELMEILSSVEGLSSVKYDVVMESPEETLEGTMWQKGQKMRMEGEMEGVETVVIVDSEERTAIAYLPAENMATKVSLGEVEGVQDSSMKNQATELPEKNPVVVGREVINEMDCIVVEYTTENETTGTMWIWVDHGLPVKFEVEGTVVEAKNVDFAEIEDAKFELPEGVEIMEIPADFGDDIIDEVPQDITDQIPEDILNELPDF